MGCALRSGADSGFTQQPLGICEEFSLFAEERFAAEWGMVGQSAGSGVGRTCCPSCQCLCSASSPRRGHFCMGLCGRDFQSHPYPVLGSWQCHSLLLGGPCDPSGQWAESMGELCHLQAKAFSCRCLRGRCGSTWRNEGSLHGTEAGCISQPPQELICHGGI